MGGSVAPHSSDAMVGGGGEVRAPCPLEGDPDRVIHEPRLNLVVADEPGQDRQAGSVRGGPPVWALRQGPA